MLGQVRMAISLHAHYDEIDQILGTRAASCSCEVEVDPQQMMFLLLRSVRARGKAE